MKKTYFPLFTLGFLLVGGCTPTDETTQSAGAFNSDILIQNNLEILDGMANLSGQVVEVQNDVDIYDYIVIKESVDVLDVGGDITFHSGSQQPAFAEISDGLISIEGDWYFNNGTDAVLEGTNNTSFTGSQVSTIYCEDPDAHFKDLIVNKDLLPTDTVFVLGTENLHVAGSLTVTGGVLHLSQHVKVGNE